MSETSVDFPTTISEKRVFSAFHSGLGLAPNTLSRKSPLSRIFGMTCPDSVQIPSNRWLKFMSGRRRKRGRLFGDAPEAPRVSPKPYARSRATRPPTVNRPASAIPLTETCAASETRRVARLRAASCATPASLPSASPRMGHGRDRRRLPFGEWTRACLSRGGSGGARVSRGEFFGPDGTGDAPVHLAGPMRKRKPEVLFTSRSPVGGVPEKARSELLPAPQRWIRSLSAIAQPENPG